MAASINSAQRQAMASSAELWRRSQFATAAVDHGDIEACIVEAYERAGFTRPAEIVWCQSPMAVEKSRKEFWHELHPGESVKSAVIDAPLTRALKVVYEQPSNVHQALVQSFDFRPRTAATFAVVDETLEKAVSNIRWPWSTWRNRITDVVTRRSVFVPFLSSRWAPYELRDAWGLCQFAHRNLGLQEQLDYMAPLCRLAEGAIWLVPHERVCWVSERWTRLELDATHRLHCATGPAMAFPDGTAWHFWKNIQVPAWTITSPDKITANSIDAQSDPFVRRCMIELMTPEAFVASGAATRVNVDPTGTLWMRRWGATDIWAAVEVLNGTANPDGTVTRYFLQVPGHLRSAQEAVAWTYGMSAQDYARLELRT